MTVFPSQHCPGAVLGLLVAICCTPSGAAGQLRPYDPFPWEIFAPNVEGRLELGGAALWDQRASLAGTEGRLVELGTFRAMWRTGPVALDASGTVWRTFQDRGRFAEPFGGAEQAEDGRRSDSGDYRIATTVALTPTEASEAAALRFGTRLPTTDNTIGLERDRIDFFAMVLGRADRGLVRATAALGIGIHGTRTESFEQSDVLVYSLGLQARLGPIEPFLHLVGHADGLANRTIRGNEELSELRLGFRTGGRYWFDVQGVRGLTEMGPGIGVLLTAGTSY